MWQSSIEAYSMTALQIELIINASWNVFGNMFQILSP